MRAMTEDEKELGAIIIRAQAKQYGDEETLSTVAERAYQLGRETGQREAASLRHAALLAAGIHGGPGAWRWAHDKQGTTLDDEAAWERMLGEMAHGPALQWEDVPGALQSRARLCGNDASAPRVYLRIRYSDVWHIEYMFDGKAHTTEEGVLDCPPVLTDELKRMAEKWARYEGWIR